MLCGCTHQPITNLRTTCYDATSTLKTNRAHHLHTRQMIQRTVLTLKVMQSIQNAQPVTAKISQNTRQGTVIRTLVVAITRPQTMYSLTLHRMNIWKNNTKWRWLQRFLEKGTQTTHNTHSFYFWHTRLLTHVNSKRLNVMNTWTCRRKEF